jgi:hypothetical protein
MNSGLKNEYGRGSSSPLFHIHPVVQPKKYSSTEIKTRGEVLDYKIVKVIYIISTIVKFLLTLFITCMYF